MFERANLLLLWKVAFAVVAVLVLASPALAYVGPAPGPEFFGYFASLVTLVGVALTSLLLWPINALRRWLRGEKPVARNGAELLAAAIAEPTPGQQVPVQ
jgi:hypothetical protein